MAPAREAAPPGRSSPTTCAGAMGQPCFANACSMCNALDALRLRQAGRPFHRGGALGAAALTPIEPDDILAGRDFQVPPSAPELTGGSTSA